MRPWIRGSVLATAVGLGAGALWLPGSSGAEVAPSAEAVPEAVGPNLLGNSGFESPAITGGFRTIEPGTTLGTCRTIPGVTVKAGCWTSTLGFAGVDVVRTLWAAQQGKQSLDLNAAFGAGAVTQAAPVTPGPYLFRLYVSRSPNAPVGELSHELDASVTLFNGAGKVLDSVRFNVTHDIYRGFVPINALVDAPAGAVAAVVTVASDRSRGPHGLVIDSVQLTRE